MTSSNVSNTKESELSGSLGTPKIVFLVIAAAAPLVAMVGTVPISLAIGNGAGVPGTYLIAAIALLCFAVGYVAMSHQITSSSGFYAYIARGLGRPPAAAGGVLALVAYNALVFALAGGIGYFAHTIVASEIGVTLPWWVWSLIAIAIVALLGHREINLSAWVLGTLMVVEVSMLLALDLAIIVTRGTAAFPTTSFAPHTIFSGASGVAIMFAFGSFAGFESGALYGKESRNPRRTVGRATYIAVCLIGVFYCFTSWMAVGAVGADHVQAAVGNNPGVYFLGLAHDFLSSAFVHVLSWLVITSVFASMLSAHNASSRYLFSLGRERLLPSGLGEVNARHASPAAASLLQSALNVLVVAAFAVAGADPYLNLVTTMSGLSTIGIVLLEAITAVAVIAFFWTRPERHWWRTVVAPLVGLAGLGAATVLILKNFPTLSGTHSTFVNALPYVVIAAAVALAAYTLWLRSRQPDRYAQLGSVAELAPAVDAELAPRVEVGAVGR